MWAQLLTGNITNKNKSKEMSAFSVSATNPQSSLTKSRMMFSDGQNASFFHTWFWWEVLFLSSILSKVCRGKLQGQQKHLNSVTYPRGTEINCLLQGLVIMVKMRVSSVIMAKMRHFSILVFGGRSYFCRLFCPRFGGGNLRVSKGI